MAGTIMANTIIAGTTMAGTTMADTTIIETTQHSLSLVLIRSSYEYMKAFSIYRYSSFLDIIKNIISSNKSHYSNNYISRYY